MKYIFFILRFPSARLSKVAYNTTPLASLSLPYLSIHSFLSASGVGCVVYSPLRPQHSVRPSLSSRNPLHPPSADAPRTLGFPTPSPPIMSPLTASVAGLHPSRASLVSSLLTRVRVSACQRRASLGNSLDPITAGALARPRSILPLFFLDFSIFQTSLEYESSEGQRQEKRPSSHLYRVFTFSRSRLSRCCSTTQDNRILSRSLASNPFRFFH